MMYLRWSHVYIGAILSAIAGMQAFRTEYVPASDELSPERRKEVVNQMKTILSQTKISRIAAELVPADLVPYPVLQWDDIPRGHHYGTLWIWGTKGRPAAAIEMYTTGFAKQIEQWPGNVVHSLATEQLEVKADFSWDWAPTQPGLTLHSLDGVPVPAATNQPRTLQMRALAKRFSGRQTWLGDSAALRLLPKPVWEYESEDHGVLTGGLFVLAHGGTNPEVILVLEANRRENKTRWEFGCVRLGHAEMSVSFDNRPVWSVPTYGERNRHSPYYSIAKP